MIVFDNVFDMFWNVSRPCQLECRNFETLNIFPLSLFFFLALLTRFFCTVSMRMSCFRHTSGCSPHPLDAIISGLSVATLRHNEEHPSMLSSQVGGTASFRFLPMTTYIFQINIKHIKNKAYNKYIMYVILVSI